MTTITARQASRLLGALRSPDVAHGEDDGSPFGPGAILAGRFRIDAELTETGSSRLLAATDLREGLDVVVKSPLSASSSTRARFAREAHLLAELVHPRLVRYVVHGSHGDAPFVVVERLAGETLAMRLARAGPLAASHAIALLDALLDAVSHLHERGIVHRDLKPSNVFLVGGRPEDPVLLDLGLARAVSDVDEITEPGIAVGTEGYAAPETARGAPASVRADVYSLGRLFVRSLGAGADEGAVPVPLRPLVDAMCGADPRSRLADAGAVRKRLADLSRPSARDDCDDDGGDFAMIARAFEDAARAGDRRDLAALGVAWLERNDRGRHALIARQLGLLRAAHEGAPTDATGDEAALRVIRALLPTEPSDADLGAVRLLEAQAASWRGEFRAAMPLAEEAARLLPGGTGAWFRAVSEVALAAPRLGAFSRLEWAHGVFEAALEASAPRWVVLGAARTAIALFTVRATDAGDRLADQLERVVSLVGVGDPLVAARLLRVRATRALAHGDLETYTLALEDAIRGYDLAGDVRGACQDRANLGFALIEIGEPGRAVPVLLAALEEAERRGLAASAALATKNLALAALERGVLEAAAIHSRDAAIRASEGGNPRLESVALALSSRVAFERGLAAEALAAARGAIDVAPTAVERSRALGAETDALVAVGRLSDAAQAGAAALDALREAREIDGGEAAIYLAASRAIELAGDPALAAQTRREGIARLQTRAARFRDEARRARFLARPDHVRLRGTE